MKKLNKIIASTLTVLTLSTLVSCAAGSATAAYSVKAHTADGLSAEAESRVVERTKRELMYELSQQPCR